MTEDEAISQLQIILAGALYHESAHAAIAVGVGRKIESFTFSAAVGDPHLIAKVTIHLPRELEPSKPLIDDPRIRTIVEDELCIYLVASLAEEKYHRIQNTGFRRDPVGASMDDEQARAMAERLVGRGRVDAIIARMRMRAESLVDNEQIWQRIDELARAALLKWQAKEYVIGGSEVERICKVG
jgi:hypothetical protein